MTREDLQRHFGRLKTLGLIALGGLTLTLAAIPFFSNETLFISMFLLGALLWLPGLLYLVVFTLWHW